MPDLPLVDIVVLNWNGLEDTLKCLQSLDRLEYPNFNVIIVDNGSTDGSKRIIRQRFQGCKIIEIPENLGYTGGNNIGLRRSLKGKAEYMLLLNNDTEVAPDFLSLLVRATEADHAIGIAGPMIYYYKAPKVVWSAGGDLDWRGRSRMIGINEIDTGQFGINCSDVDFVSGCAMLIKKKVLMKIGLLDERFFSYFEEAELCVRAKQSGFRIVNVPSSRVWHKIPLDARESSPMVHYYMTRNRLLFLKVIGAGIWPLLYTLSTEYFRTLLSWSLRPKWRTKKRHRKMMLRAIVDASLGRWGRYTGSEAN